MISNDSNDSLDLAFDAEFRATLLGCLESPPKEEIEEQSCQPTKLSTDEEVSQASQSIDSIFHSMMQEINEAELSFDNVCGEDEASCKRIAPGMLSPPRLTPLRSSCPDRRFFGH